MTDFSYKKYSLEKLEEWVHDAMSSDATPNEIYDCIVKIVDENYYYHKDQTARAYELLCKLNGNGKGHIKSYDDCVDKVLSCDKDDQSPECKGAWNSFWEENYYPEEYKGSTVSSAQYTEEELNAMCDKAASDQEKEKCREYNLREADYYDKRAKLDAEYDKVVKWRLPVQQKIEEGIDDYYVQFPDDLLEAANLNEGDQIEWVDNGDGSYTIRKPTKPLGMDEC